MGLMGFSFLPTKYHPLFTSAITPDNMAEYSEEDESYCLFRDCGMEGIIDLDIFKKALNGFSRFHAAKRVIAICDFTRPSNQDRFFVIDLDQSKLIVQSLVAHGKNSGLELAQSFSNQMQSLKSSLGFFRIGQKIKSPKHGDALLLEGLEPGLNDQARQREIIIHAADYVSHDYIKKNGRLGRSFGCPALPSDVLKSVLPVLEQGALLYIHGKNSVALN
jgi:hypothetical protein